LVTKDQGWFGRSHDVRSEGPLEKKRSGAPPIRPFRWSTSRRKLTLLTALLLAVGSIATSFGSYAASTRSIRKSILTNQLPLTGDSVYSEVQRDLLRPVSISDQMAHDTFLRDWYFSGEKDESPIRRYLAEIKNRFNATTSFFVSDRTRNYYHPNGIIQQVDENDPDDAWYYRVKSMSAPYEINVDSDEANHEIVK
jgi:hypothetical protein